MNDHAIRVCRQRRTANALVPVWVVLAALISSCGGSSNPTSPSSSSSSSSTTTTTSSGTASGAYTLNGGSASKSNETFTASASDTSAILVSGGGSLALNNVTVTTSGNTSSQDNSSFYGLNAAVLAQAASRITMTGGSITTTGTGANGAFATGSGASVVMSNVAIRCSANGGHGVMATQGGSLTLTNVDMNTAGANSGAIATDRGGGTIVATGGNVVATGQDSPAVYSTGSITVSGATLSATGAEAAVIEGANSITLTNTALSSTKDGKWGVMIYQSMSGDASGTTGTFRMTGGALTYSSSTGPLFYVTNSTGIITMSGVSASVGSGVLLKASTGSWGSSGSNGGNAVLTADGQALAGNIVVDASSTAALTLKNGSTLSGAIDAADTGKTVSLTLDASSRWVVTGTSNLTGLSDSAGISGTTITNIVGNGFTVYYDASNSANGALNWRTFSLANGGQLVPK